MSAVDDYNRFLAESGAGYDAAGRVNYTGPNYMYMGPRQFAETDAVRKQLELRAFQAQPAEMRIRQLMDQLEQQRIASGMGPGTIRLAPQELATGNSSQTMTYAPNYGK